MRKTRVFINGFGRIGRAALRIMIDDDTVEVVGINDIYDFSQMAQLFSYDSVYGRYPKDVTLKGDKLIIENQSIQLYNIKTPQQLKLDNVDVLLQCTGIFLSEEVNTIYLKNGAKKVLISAPTESNIPTYIMNVNHHKYKNEPIISNSSCSANAIIPIFQILENHYHIESASVSMLHSYTAYQSLLDVKHYSKDIRRTRSATQNIQPLISSATKECEKFYPHLSGKVSTKSIRIPISATTLYDITLKVTKGTDKDTLHKVFNKATQSTFHDMLSMTKQPIVSTDMIGQRYAAIIDSSLTQIIGDDLLKIFAWQDNEYGYANQLVRMIKEISR